MQPRPRLSGLDSTDPPFRTGVASPATTSASDAPSLPTVRFLDTVGAVPRSRKRKSDSTELPIAAQNLLPESELYSKLLEYERRVDTVIEMRNVEVADALQRVDRFKSVLRIYIWNESHLQKDPMKESPSSFWKLKISGKLLPMKQKPGEIASNMAEMDSHQGLPFAHFIKSLDVEVDPQNTSGSSTKIKWIKSMNSGDEEKEVFEVLRPGEKALPVKISIVFDNQAPTFRLTERFAKLLGFELGTRSKVITELWNYIKTKNLQTNKDPSVIMCDPDLKALFGGAESMPLSMISGKLNDLLTPADKVILDYTIQLDGSPAVYDVELELPSTLQSRATLPFFQRHTQDAEIARLDHVIGDTGAEILERKRRRAFFMGFSENPIEFVNTLLKAQSKEVSRPGLGVLNWSLSKQVRLIKRLGERDCYEVETQTEFFKGKWVEDAVVKYFQRRLAAGH